MQYNHQYSEQITDLRKRYVHNYDFSEYLKEVRDLISDWKYIQEHHKRTCINKKYQIIAIPTTGAMSGRFLKDIFSYLIAWGNFKNEDKNEDIVLEALVIFNILQRLFKILQTANKPNETYEDYITMEKIIKYLYDINLANRTGDFVGCSSGCSGVDRMIQEYKNNLKETINAT